MFAPAVETVKQLKLPNDIFFFGETLHRPKHNALTYNAVPKGHIALFGAVHVSEQVWLPHEDVSGWANDFKIDVVPLISAGRLVHDELIENLHKFLQLESYLGGPNIEGIVIKNLHQDMMIGEQYVPFLTGKYVSEAFKEVHSNKKYGTAERKSKLEQLYESYRNEARWNKAVQHLKEKGTFAAELPTIGKIISEVKLDILEERSDEIKEDLFSIFKADLLRYSVRGLPEWFKEKLAKGDFDDK